METYSVNGKAFLFGPFVGELYWEFGRFAPMLPYYRHKYQNEDVKFIVLTREERFDMYGCFADVLVPLKIAGDYEDKLPNCFRLDNYSEAEYLQLAKNFRKYYEKKYEIVDHIYPRIDKASYVDKDQFSRDRMIFKYKPRQKNFEVVEQYLSNFDNKKIILLAPRYRRGFKRNWKYWPTFYDLLSREKELLDKYNFVICGKPGEYIPDEKKRFLDMNDITLQPGCSLVGILMVFLSKAYFTFGSQSSIPNMSLIYGVEVLEFGCQRYLHTVVYNIRNTPITFIENFNYDIDPNFILNELKNCLKRKEMKNG